MTSYSNSAPPTITGSRVVGGTINATSGTWSPTPSSFTYQWQRADDISGTNAEDITGATGATYTIDPLDTNKVLRVGVYPGDPVPQAPPTIAIPGTSKIRYTGNEGTVQGDGRYGLVYLTASRTTDLQTIKTLSPTTKVIAYKDPSACTNGGATSTSVSWNSPVSFEEAQAHDATVPTDEWLVYDAPVGGNPIWDPNHHVVPSPIDYFANVASPSYQGTALARVQATMTAPSPADFDGVFWDNCNPTYVQRSSIGAPSPRQPGYATPPGGGARVLFTDTLYRAGMLAFNTAVSDVLKTAGYYVVGNAGVSGDNDGSATNTWWTSVAPHLSGLNQEFWAQGPDGILFFNSPPSDWHGNYNNWLTIIDTAQNAGADFYGGGHGTMTDTAKMQYTKAAFLLKWDGGSGGALFWSPSPGTQSAFSTYWTSWVGTPSGAKTAVGGGWKRLYSNGIVIVNPNGAGGASITFPLGGSYFKPDGSSASSVTLTPTTAMILTTYAP